MTDRKDEMPPLGDRITLAWNPNRGVHVMPSPPHNEAVMFRNYVSEKSHEAIVSALTAERDALKARLRKLRGLGSYVSANCSCMHSEGALRCPLDGLLEELSNIEVAP